MEEEWRDRGMDGWIDGGVMEGWMDEWGKVG